MTGKKKTVRAKKAILRFNKILVGLLVLVLLLGLFFWRLDEIFPPIHQLTPRELNKRYNEAKVATPSATPLIKNKVIPTLPSGFCLNVPILYYHHIAPLDTAKKGGFLSLTVDNSVFEQQMAYLSSKGYDTLSVDNLAQALVNHQSLPAKSILITLDDGYDDAYTFAYPILYKYHLKANLLIATGLINNPGYLQWDELKRMVDSGLIFVSNHTWSHAALAKLSDERIKYEITTAQTELKEKLGIDAKTFAYPYGSENQKVIDIVKQNGFLAAYSTIPGSLQCDSYIFSLRRMRVGNIPLAQYGI